MSIYKLPEHICSTDINSVEHKDIDSICNENKSGYLFAQEQIIKNKYIWNFSYDDEINILYLRNVYDGPSISYFHPEKFNIILRLRFDNKIISGIEIPYFISSYKELLKIEHKVKSCPQISHDIVLDLLQLK